MTFDGLTTHTCSDAYTLPTLSVYSFSKRLKQIHDIFFKVGQVKTKVARLFLFLNTTPYTGHVATHSDMERDSHNLNLGCSIHIDAFYGFHFGL